MGADSDNYEIRYQTGTLTITPTTAIANIRVTETSGAVYDISGRRVNGKMGKGLYIVNGKKIAK